MQGKRRKLHGELKAKAALEPSRALLAPFADAGGGLLPGGLGGSLGSLRPPRDLQQRSGRQFTGVAFTDRLLQAGIRISRDGRGRALDNIFVELLWRSLKVDEVYLRDYASAREAHVGITRWFDFYNHRRPRSTPRPPAVRRR